MSKRLQTVSFYFAFSVKNSEQLFFLNQFIPILTLFSTLY